jgi:hypothetical protein
MFDQVSQQAEHLGLNRQHLPVAAQLEARCIQLDIGEHERVVHPSCTQRQASRIEDFAGVAGKPAPFAFLGRSRRRLRRLKSSESLENRARSQQTQTKWVVVPPRLLLSDYSVIAKAAESFAAQRPDARSDDPGAVFDQRSRSPVPGIWQRLGHIPRANRNVLRVFSDPRPTFPDPDLISDHPGVQSGGFLPLDMIDFWGYRRPTEGAFLTAFGTPPPGYDAFCSSTSSVCNPVRNMGSFTNGVPLNRIQNAGDLEVRGQLVFVP